MLSLKLAALTFGIVWPANGTARGLKAGSIAFGVGAERGKTMLKKICAATGCKEIIPANERYCDRHKNAYNHEIRRTVDRQYDDFYHSKEWRILQGCIMKKYFGLCVYSYVIEHKTVRAGAVHHIVEIKDNFTLRLCPENLIPLSEETHSMVRKWYAENKSKTQEMFRECLRLWDELFSDNP